jgi:hypothetical protein
LSIGQKEKAKQLVEEGLSYSPDSKTLRDLLIALGGDPNTVKRKSNPKDSAPDSARPAEPKTPSGNDRDPTTVAN